jgi:hypothetical protein
MIEWLRECHRAKNILPLHINAICPIVCALGAIPVGRGKIFFALFFLGEKYFAPTEKNVKETERSVPFTPNKQTKKL